LLQPLLGLAVLHLFAMAVLLRALGVTLLTDAGRGV
jgi:hypothetical protein